jgi:hypothetical protein
MITEKREFSDKHVPLLVVALRTMLAAKDPTELAMARANLLALAREMRDTRAPILAQAFEGVLQDVHAERQRHAGELAAAKVEAPVRQASASAGSIRGSHNITCAPYRSRNSFAQGPKSRTADLGA